MICLLIPVMCSTAFSAGTDSRRTVMIYMCGSNLESDNGQGTRTIGEIRNSEINSDELNVVLLLGGTRSWVSGYDTDSLTVLEMGGRRPKTVDTFDLASMGEADTLSNFLNYCYENYPAESYDLVIWDHGGGPIYGVCQDSITFDMLYIDELCKALDDSPFAKEPLDILAFNACLMGSAEVAESVSPYAKYMVATEDSMYGLAYSWLAGAEQYEDPKDLAIRIAETSYAMNQEIIEEQEASEINAVAVIDLSKADALSQAVNDFFTKASDELNDDTFSSVSDFRRETVSFGLGDSGTESGFDLVDLGDMVSRAQMLNPDKLQEVHQAVEDAIVYLQAAREECSGLTVYYPFLNKDQLPERMAVYKDLGFAPGYNSYLQNFTAILSGTPLAEWIDLITGTQVTKDNRLLFSLQLNEEQTRHFGAAQLNVLHKDEEGNFTFSFSDPETQLDNERRLTGEFSGTALYATDENGEMLTDALEYHLGMNGRYLIPAVLTKSGKDEGEDVIHNALISCKLEKSDAGKKLIPGAVQVWEEELHGYTTAYGTSLADYDSMELAVVSRTPVRDANGTLMDFWDWEEARSKQYVLPVDGSWNFTLLNDTLDLEQLYAVFQVTDSQNNVYSSEPLALKTMDPADTEVRISYDDADLVIIHSLSADVNNDTLFLNGTLENISSAETIIHLENLKVNDVPLTEGADVFGSGDSWGLLEGEAQMLMLSIPYGSLADMDAITQIDFDLTLEDAVTGENLGTVPVQMVLQLPLE